MQLTLFSFISSVIWSSIFISGTYFLRKIPRFVDHFGICVMSLLYLFSIGRMLLPLEFTPTIVIDSRVIYPAILRAIQEPIVEHINLSTVLIVMWIFVAAILLCRYVVKYCKAIRYIFNYAKPCGMREKRTLKCIQCAAKQNVSVTIYTCIDTDIPFGFGVFNKRILLPQKEYNDDELYYILLHEYTHFMNHDTIVKTMISVFCIIFWWNPVVYLLKKDLEQTLEIKCDLAVVKSFDATQKANYLQAIVSSMKKVSIPSKVPYASTTLIRTGQAIEIKERFRVIMQCSNKRTDNLYSAIFLVAFVFCGIISYTFLPQPVFEAPKSNDGSIDYDASNSYIVQKDDGTYWLFVENQDPQPIESSYAELLINNGFPRTKE